MARRPPERVDPWLLAEQERTLEGRIPLGALSRLAPLLMEDSGEAAFVLKFFRDDHGRHRVNCRVEARLQLECQRCLEAMEHSVAREGELALVQGLLEAGRLPDELDPLLLQENELLTIGDLVEDELLLSLPAVPRHAHRCGAALEPPAGQTPDGPAPDNPFAVLAALKGDDTDHN